MTAFDFKILAFTFMLIDHIGRVFMDSHFVMIGLGRLSFPLFAWLAAQGEIHTSNLRNYLLRLVAIGLVTQPVYAEIWRWLFPSSSPPWNILFTLAYGVGLLRLMRHLENPWGQVSVCLLLAGVAEFLRIEGGAAAILSMSVIAQFKLGNDRANLLWYGLLVGLEFLYIGLFQESAIELMGLLAPLLLLWYNGERGAGAKWFYLIYPLHFVGILVTKQFIWPLIFSS